MNPITIPNITIPVIGLPAIGIPSVGFPSASGGGLAWPAGMKESIKAIYDPAKQGMTNYDVIESYAEDFSKFPWNNKKEKYTGTLTPNTLTITNVAVTSALIYTNSKPENFKVYITGIKDNQQVIFGDDTSTYRALIVEKDGVYDVNWEDNHHSYCIWCNFLGDCNITITQLPTSILKDLSGNGNHAYLYGGKGKLNSGMGVYQEDFTTWNNKDKNSIEVKSNKIHVTYNKFTKEGFITTIYTPYTFKPYKLKFKGITDKPMYIGTANDYSKGIIIEKDGIYEVKFINGYNGVYAIGFIDYVGDCDITITQIPDYPNQLCYDGKMYAVCYGFPILTDYTVMADRTWFENEGNRVFITKGNIWPNCAFTFEKINVALRSETYSYSQSTNIDDLIGKSGITYQTKQSYNGKIIGVGTSSDGDILLIGGQSKGEYIGCHGKIIIADRSFTEDEITWLKDNWKKI